MKYETKVRQKWNKELAKNSFYEEISHFTYDRLSTLSGSFCKNCNLRKIKKWQALIWIEQKIDFWRGAGTSPNINFLLYPNQALTLLIFLKYLSNFLKILNTSYLDQLLL